MSWHSEALFGRRMHVNVHGHAGARVIAFPTSKGWNVEWSDRAMLHEIGDQIAAGLVQVWAVPSVDEESWYADWKRIEDRADWAMRYDRFLYEELLPRMDAANPNRFTIATGASFGGFHALSFGLRHPDRVDRILAMSALCDIRRFSGGWLNSTAWQLNPVSFIPREHEAERLALLRRLDIILAIGESDSLARENHDFSAALWERGIGNALRIWKGWAHDWPDWRRMLTLYLPGHD